MQQVNFISLPDPTSTNIEEASITCQRSGRRVEAVKWGVAVVTFPVTSVFLATTTAVLAALAIPIIFGAHIECGSREASLLEEDCTRLVKASAKALVGLCRYIYTHQTSDRVVSSS